MASRRFDLRAVKHLRSYTVFELAECCGVHKNTVRNWQRDGLEPVDGNRPILFHGGVVHAFLSSRKTSRKRPCPAGTLYCFRCRAPRPPAQGTVAFLSINALSCNIRATCATCGTVMHRRARNAALTSILPDCVVQFVEGQTRLRGRSAPSLNCDLERQATT